MNGPMAGGTMESGRTTTCMGKVSIPGKMEESMKGITTMTGSMDLEYTPGRTADNILVNGRMESSMVKEPTGRQQARRREESGKTEKESSGLNEIIIILIY